MPGSWLWSEYYQTSLQVVHAFVAFEEWKINCIMLLDRLDFHLCLSFLPEWFSSYTSANMDTIPKLINHLLVAMAVCNLFMVSFASQQVNYLQSNLRYSRVKPPPPVFCFFPSGVTTHHGVQYNSNFLNAVLTECSGMDRPQSRDDILEVSCPRTDRF